MREGFKTARSFTGPGYPDTTLGRAHTSSAAPVISPVDQGPTRPRERPHETSKESEGLLWVLGTRSLRATAWCPTCLE